MKRKTLFRVLSVMLATVLLLTGSAMASGEPGHPEYAEENKTAQKGAIVLTGSSLCEWFPIDEILSETGDDFVIYNRGYGGYVMTQLMEVLDTAVIDLAPSAVFINIGTNDIDRLGEEYTIEDMMANYGAILDRIKTEVPGCEIYVLAYYPCTPNTGTGRIQRTLEQILEVNAHVEAMAAEHDCIYLDINAPLQDETGHLKDEYAADSIHLTDEAYRVIYQSLRPYFEAVTNGSSGEPSGEVSREASGEASGETKAMNMPDGSMPPAPPADLAPGEEPPGGFGGGSLGAPL